MPLPAPVTLLPQVLGGARPCMAGTDGVASQDKEDKVVSGAVNGVASWDEVDKVVSLVETEGVASRDEVNKVVSLVETDGEASRDEVEKVVSGVVRLRTASSASARVEANQPENLP